MTLEPATLAPALEPYRDAGRWLLAFSGGLDSTVLLHLLQRCCAENPAAPPLAAVHINHNLQAAAVDWERHCERACAALGVPLLLREVVVGVAGRGTEAAARDARYRALAATLQAGDVMFLAHHQDDQVETLLLRWLRGAGLRGLQGMPRTRPLGPGSLARPLLAWPREALEDYARQHRLQWIEDPSNADTGFDRNYLRHEVLPMLARRWPGYRGSVTRSALQLGAAAAALDRLLPAPPSCTSRLGDPGIPVASLVEGSGSGWLTLEQWLGGLGLALPPRAPTQEFLRQLQAGGGSPELAWSGQCLRRFGDAVYLLPPVEGSLGSGPWRLAPGATLALPGAGVLQLEPAGDGPGIALGPGESLTVCRRSGGERCQPLGRAGGSQRLKKLLQEAGVPPWWRERLPLLYLGEELLAVADLWLCVSSRSVPAGDPAAWRPVWRRNTSAPPD